MSYNTLHKLTVIPDSFKETALSKLEEQLGFNPVDGDKCPWYNSNNDMLTLSKTVPALLILDGNGEETGDIWRKGWLNGELVMDWRLPTIKPPEPSEELITKATALAYELGTPLPPS